MRVTFEDGTMVVETEDGRRRRATVQSAAAAAWGQGPGQKVVKVAPEGRDLVKAPIAGSVLRLSAEDGARVERGQPILVIEAMKMQNTITAPQDGVVRFEVKPGQSVPSGALLARVTSPEGTA
jgi:biotin carboxyl carrier protein